MRTRRNSALISRPSTDRSYEKGFTGAYYQEAAANKSHDDVKAFLKGLFQLQ